MSEPREPSESLSTSSTVSSRGPADPDWKQAHAPSIHRALTRALARPSGGWFVLGSTRSLLRARRPQRHHVNGVELVSWMASGSLAVAPAACPHMGAHLAGGSVDSTGCLVCPWHGLALPASGDRRVDGQGRWSPLPVHHDGVLTWVRLLDPEPTDVPILPERPTTFIDAVIRREIVCEPADVIANRLDPWHGVHFHPYAFARLRVVEATDEELLLDVAYRAAPGRTLDVRARFHCPEPRTIVMTITDGVGAGSVVETHATPLVLAAPGVEPKTAVIEATLATSDHPAFATMLKGSMVARPMIGLMAARLWRDDARYAARTYSLRARAWKPGDA